MRLAVIMDPIESISCASDTTFAMLIEASRRNWQLDYMQAKDLFCRNGKAYGLSCKLSIDKQANHRYELASQKATLLSDFDIILMRKDPPFDMNYIIASYFLDHAEKSGTVVINSPQALRNCNEKFIISHFPNCIAPTMISNNRDLLVDFHKQHPATIFKPLDVMGGQGIFVAKKADDIETKIKALSKNYTKAIMAQKYLAEINQVGDKRIILIDGEPLPYVLKRLPKPDSILANLVAGGQGLSAPLNERDLWICQQISPFLKQKGLFFVGIDVIGCYLTEINVTSPTGVTTLDKLFNVNICQILFDQLLSKYPKLRQH